MQTVHTIIIEIIKTVANEKPKFAQNFLETAKTLRYYRNFTFP